MDEGRFGGFGVRPPAALLATTHILAMLWRFSPAGLPAPSGPAQDAALSIAAARVHKWDAMAAELQEGGLFTTHPTAKVSEVLRLAHDVRPRLSNRAIGQRVDMHHDTVGKLLAAAVRRLGQAAPAQ